ncbi:hypothetical protein FACS189472_18850 [Alphaproteobacteria bacterium]|nr:hypothetical protein FACS189472_18850 [Alphaproteobacteria bacterium]
MNRKVHVRIWSRVRSGDLPGLGNAISVSSFKLVYLYGYHLAEVQIAEKLKEIRDSSKNTKKIRIDEALKQAQKKLSISLANKQIEAVKAAITNQPLSTKVDSMELRLKSRLNPNSA